MRTNFLNRDRCFNSYYRLFQPYALPACHRKKHNVTALRSELRTPTDFLALTCTIWIFSTIRNSTLLNRKFPPLRLFRNWFTVNAVNSLSMLIWALFPHQKLSVTSLQIFASVSFSTTNNCIFL